MDKPTCLADGCDRATVGRGMCRNHYARFMRNGTLEYSRPPRDKSRDDDTHKTCTRCGKAKPRTDFYAAARNKDGKRATCMPCDNAHSAKNYDTNREAVLVRQRAYSKTPERKQYMADYLPGYYEANRHLYMQAAAKRRAMIQAAFVDAGITVASLRKRHGDQCVFCFTTMTFGKDVPTKYHPSMATIEHMLPLSRNGKHSWDNTRLSCFACNISKNDKTPDEYAEYMARITT